MKAAIMQPYLFPYIGYFQLIASVDLFVVYDDIKYTKKGWINRNRMLLNGKDEVFSLPLKRASDFLNVCERELSPDFDHLKFLGRIEGAYRRAPYFSQTFPLIEQIVQNPERNLFSFILNSIKRTCEHLGIVTDIRISSEISVDTSLKSQARVLGLCEAVGANAYVNSIGGVDLYSKDEFHARGIELQFIKSKPFEYRQFDNEFVPWLSIIDVMMFGSIESIRDRIDSGYLLQ